MESIFYRTEKGEYIVDFSIGTIIELIDAKDVVSVIYLDVELKGFNTEINEKELEFSDSNIVEILYWTKEEIKFCKGFYNQRNRNFDDADFQIIFDNRLICYRIIE